MNSHASRNLSYSARQRLEAAQWFMDVHEAQDPSPQLLQDWLSWLDASESNRLAFQAVERAYHEAPAVALPAAAKDEDYDPSVPVAEWLVTSKGRTPVRTKNFFARQSGKIAGALAATVVIAVASGPLFDLVKRINAPAFGEFATRTGEHRQLLLADGSQVVLGARSRLSVSFTPTARNIRLDFGEAFFSVHKDPNRPFNVQALGGMITAVGTAFNVRATNDRVTVAVTEGVVNVSDISQGDAANSAHPAQRAVQPLRLRRGEQLSFITPNVTTTMQGETLLKIDPAQPTRWRDGWLVFRDEPLRYVIADVERYTDREISVDSAVSSELRYTGVVYKNSVVEWIEALPEVFPVKVESAGGAMRVAPKD